MHLQNIASDSEILNIKVGIEEMLKNAVEHGNLSITAKEKSDAIEQGNYGDLLKERLQDTDNSRKKIRVDAQVTPEQVKIMIADEGEGFDWTLLPELHPESLLQYSGRGVFLTRIYFDAVQYNEKGNQVTLVKRRKSR